MIVSCDEMELCDEYEYNTLPYIQVTYHLGLGRISSWIPDTWIIRSKKKNQRKYSMSFSF